MRLCVSLYDRFLAAIRKVAPAGWEGDVMSPSLPEVGSNVCQTCLRQGVYNLKSKHTVALCNCPGCSECEARKKKLGCRRVAVVVEKKTQLLMCEQCEATH